MTHLPGLREDDEISGVPVHLLRSCAKMLNLYHLQAKQSNLYITSRTQMPLQRTPPHIYHIIKHFSATTTYSSWRIHTEQNQLISQISSILLQRHNWSSLLGTLNLSSNLIPQIFLQILDKIQTNPEISLNFFNWAKSNLEFQPDLKTHCKIIQILIRAGDTQPIKPILDSFIGVDPPTNVVYSMVQACKGIFLGCIQGACSIQSNMARRLLGERKAKSLY